MSQANSNAKYKETFLYQDITGYLYDNFNKREIQFISLVILANYERSRAETIIRDSKETVTLERLFGASISETEIRAPYKFKLIREITNGHT